MCIRDGLGLSPPSTPDPSFGHHPISCSYPPLPCLLHTAFMAVAGCPTREEPIAAAVRMANMAQVCH